MLGLEVTPVTLLIVAPVTASGSINSYIAPTEPFSSPNKTVPHGVARTGSHELMPVAIVVASPEARLIRCSAGWATPSSLQPIRYWGFARGQSTIWSMFGAALPADTTLTFRPLATVIRPAGLADACAAL